MIDHLRQLFSPIRGLLKPTGNVEGPFFLVAALIEKLLEQPTRYGYDQKVTIGILELGFFKTDYPSS